MPTVTILMSVYNGLPYVREAVESVLAQDYTDYEFLILDDASTDESVKCVQSYKDPRIRLLRNARNIGQAESLNRGLREARGRFVARMDQDDVCIPHRLARQVASLESSHDLAVLGSWGYRIDPRGNRTGRCRGQIKDTGALVGQFLLMRCLLLHPSVMFRRDAVLGAGGYNAEFAPSEDYELWTRLAGRGYKVAVQPEVLILYREHERQQSQAKLELQRGNARRAHQAFLDQFSTGPGALKVGALLRMDAELWRQCRSKQDLCEAIEQLETVLENISDRLSLGTTEQVSLRHVVFRWLGPGAAVGKSLARWPSAVFYPVFFSLSPMLIPHVRRWGGRTIDALLRLRYKLQPRLAR